MNPKNKLAEMPIRPLLYTMAVPLMLSLLVQSLYNIVDSIFVARLSETALTAASLVYSIQFLMIAVGVGTAVGLNALLSRKIGEHKPEEAFRVNALGARNLSLVARKTGAKMVQLSTDDVFDGLAQKPYTEFDNTNPKTVYGKSKCAGENYVKEFTHKHFIIRSNWVFGKGNNFVNRVLEAADQGRALAVAEDQYGSPTSAKDLARIILHLIRTNEYGTYHATCQGVCNRYEFAKEILRLAGKEEQLNPVPTPQSDLSSARPAYAVLDNFILRIIDVYEMPGWKDSLEEFMKEKREG